MGNVVASTGWEFLVEFNIDVVQTWLSFESGGETDISVVFIITTVFSHYKLQRRSRNLNFARWNFCRNPVPKCFPKSQVYLRKRSCKSKFSHWSELLPNPFRFLIDWVLEWRFGGIWVLSDSSSKTFLALYVGAFESDRSTLVLSCFKQSPPSNPHSRVLQLLSHWPLETKSFGQFLLQWISYVNLSL